MSERMGLLGKTDWKNELVAAFTVFLASSYILFLSPQLMSEAGMDFEGAFFATALAAAVGTLLVGILSNKPYVAAPGLTVGIFFTYSLVKAHNVSWQVGLAASVFAGVLLLALSITRVRVWFAQALPFGMRRGILGGVGLLLVFVGLMRAQLVVPSEHTIVGFGYLFSPGALLALFGIVITALLFVRKVKGAFLLGILLTSLVYLIVSAISGTLPPLEFFALPSNLGSVAFKADIAGLTNLNMLSVVIALFMVAFFDSIGTVSALLSREEGNGKEDAKTLGKAMIGDSLATIIGGFLGSPPQAIYTESAAAIEEGGRTGLVSVFVSVLFLLSLFLLPLVKMVPQEATAAALIIAGLLMLGTMKNIDMKDYSEGVPALLCLAAIPLTFSITYGIGIACITYVVLKMFSGKFADVHPGMHLTALLFLLDFIGLF